MHNATIEILNSRRDSFGNCYFAFRFAEHASGREVCGTVTGGESNIRAIALHWGASGDWDRSILFRETELKIREFNRLTKNWKHAGCSPHELAEFIRRELASMDNPMDNPRE